MCVRIDQKKCTYAPHRSGWTEPRPRPCAPADRGGSKGRLGGLQPSYNPDFFIKYVLINLKSLLISSFSPKFLLFSSPFVFILDPPLPTDYGSVLKNTGGFWLLRSDICWEKSSWFCIWAQIVVVFSRYVHFYYPIWKIKITLKFRKKNIIYLTKVSLSRKIILQKEIRIKLTHILSYI
jgi:hypothetical protein